MYEKALRIHPQRAALSGVEKSRRIPHETSRVSTSTMRTWTRAVARTAIERCTYPAQPSLTVPCRATPMPAPFSTADGRHAHGAQDRLSKDARARRRAAWERHPRHCRVSAASDLKLPGHAPCHAVAESLRRRRVAGTRISTLDADAQVRAYAAIEEVEREAMLAMELQPGYSTLMEV